MQDVLTTKAEEKQERKRRLTDLISRLGQSTDVPKIREEAYREGIGAINTYMVIDIRNNLWPDRPRRHKGKPKGTKNQYVAIDPNAMIWIRCPNCKGVRTKVHHNYKRKDGTITRGRDCHDCGHHFKVNRPDDGNGPQMHKSRILSAFMTEKLCSKCQQLLPIDQFVLVARNPGRFRSHCRTCLLRARSIAQAKSVLRKHGITQEQYDEMLLGQGGVCAICKKMEQDQRLRWKHFNVDHCHETGKVRGLLCSKCNLGIGNFDDDVERMQNAVNYIKAYK